MKITIEVPSLTCARCSVEAPVRPQVVYPAAAAAPSFRSVLTEINRLSDAVNVPSIDDEGLRWFALLSQRPVGWIACPVDDSKSFCADCAAAWDHVARTFAEPLPPPPSVEVAPEPAAPAVADEVQALNLTMNRMQIGSGTRIISSSRMYVSSPPPPVAEEVPAAVVTSEADADAS